MKLKAMTLWLLLAVICVLGARIVWLTSVTPFSERELGRPNSYVIEPSQNPQALLGLVVAAISVIAICFFIWKSVRSRRETPASPSLRLFASAIIVYGSIVVFSSFYFVRCDSCGRSCVKHRAVMTSLADFPKGVVLDKPLWPLHVVAFNRSGRLGFGRHRLAGRPHVHDETAEASPLGLASLPVCHDALAVTLEVFWLGHKLAVDGGKADGIGAVLLSPILWLVLSGPCAVLFMVFLVRGVRRK